MNCVYGAEPFEQPHVRSAGAEGVKAGAGGYGIVTKIRPKRTLAVVQLHVPERDRRRAKFVIALSVNSEGTE